MLNCCNNTLALYALYRLRATHSLQDRVGAKPLPVPTAARLPAQRPNSRSQVDVDAFTTVLGPDGNAPRVHEVFVPCCARSDARRERGVVVRVGNTKCGVLQAQLGNREA